MELQQLIDLKILKVSYNHVNLNLKDKVILITGGSDGLGFASAKLLSEQGAKIAMCGRRRDYLKEKADRIEKKQNEVLDIQCDVNKADECKNLVEQTISHLNRRCNLIMQVHLQLQDLRM